MSKLKKYTFHFLQFSELFLIAILILFPIYYLLTLIFPTVFIPTLDSEISFLDCSDSIIHKLSFLSCVHYLSGFTLAYGLNFGVRELKSALKDLKSFRSSSDDYIN